MDPLTHGLLGASCASSSSKDPNIFRYAVLCGFIGATAPDLDVVIRSSTDPMLGLGFHRHFTHSILFAPFGAAVVALFLYTAGVRKKLSFIQIYLFALLGMVSHGFLDSLTNYGTHYFWPLTNRRESWNLISIIDPVFTLVLLSLLITALWTRQRKFVRAGVVFALCYWGLGLVQYHRAEDALQALAAERKHTVTRYEVKPSFGNIILWRGHYLAEGTIYVDAYQLAPFSEPKRYEGGKVKWFDIAKAYPKLSRDSVQYRDLEKFHFFSDGWLSRAATKPDVIVDMRFGLLPTDTNAIWGVRMKLDQPDSHVDFVSLRKRRDGDVSQLFAMIRGSECCFSDNNNTLIGGF